MHYRSVNARINSSTKVSTLCKNLGKIGLVTSESRREIEEFLLRLGCNLMIIANLAYWHSEMDWNITILISAG